MTTVRSPKRLKKAGIAAAEALADLPDPVLEAAIAEVDGEEMILEALLPHTAQILMMTDAADDEMLQAEKNKTFVINYNSKDNKTEIDAIINNVVNKQKLL